MILYWFPPSNEVGSYRALKFIKHLNGHGWNPIVLAPSNVTYLSYDYEAEAALDERLNIYKAPIINPFAILRRSGLKSLEKLSLIIWKALNRIAIPDGAILWFFPAYFKAKKIIEKHNVKIIYATGNPFTVFLIGTLLKRKFKNSMKLVVDYRDPWTLNPFKKQSFIRHIFERNLESFVLKHSNAAIFVSDELQELQYGEFKDSTKYENLHCITNSYEETDERSEFKKKKEFIIVHAGNFYGSREPDNLLKGLSLAKSINSDFGVNVRVLFYGIYDETKFNRVMNDLNINEMIFCHGRIPKSVLVPILRQANVLLLINSYGINHHINLPAKFFDYLQARRPILCLSEYGALQRAVINTKSGVIANPANVEEIADSLLKMYDSYYVKNSDFNPDMMEIHKYTSKYTTRKLAEVFEKICIS